MIDSNILKEESERYLKYKIEYLCGYINSFSFVKESFFDGESVKIVFIDEIEQDRQNIFDVFIGGGVIKKKSGEYIDIQPIDQGELR